MGADPHAEPASRFLSVQEVRAEFLPGRSERWIKDRAKAGDFGPDIFRDGKGWLIPEAGVRAYLERCRVHVRGWEQVQEVRE